MEKKRTDHGNKKKGGTMGRNQLDTEQMLTETRKLIQAIAREMGSKCRQLFALRSLIGPTERGMPTVIGRDSALTGRWSV